MMRPILHFFFLAMACSSTASMDAQPQSEGSALLEAARSIGLGREEYVYSIHWGLIKVGRASLGSSEITRYQDREVYHIVSSARTLPFLDVFYKVRDRNEAWLETTTFHSLAFHKNLREGHFRRNELIEFDHQTGKFRATITKKNGQVINEEGPMKPWSYDVLSALYWVRAQNLNVGQEITIDVNTRRDWPLVVKVLKKEKMRTPAGDFHTIKIEPMMRDEGIFVAKGKSMQIWVTDDARKIPVVLRAEVFVGTVRAQLEEIVYNEGQTTRTLVNPEEPDEEPNPQAPGPIEKME